MTTIGIELSEYIGWEISSLLKSIEMEFPNVDIKQLMQRIDFVASKLSFEMQL